jgi:formiminoglutamase
MTAMTSLFELTTPPDPNVFVPRGDRNDPRLGEVVRSGEEFYDRAEIAILGCAQDEGVRRNGGRPGAAKAPDAIRRQFYKLTTFNIARNIIDVGNVKLGNSLEETHENHAAVVAALLRDGKRVIVLGGGNDVSYPDGVAMSETYGAANWIAVNVDSHLDVRVAEQRNSGTPYRQLLEEKLLRPDYFYEVGYQTHFCSPIYYDYIRNLGVHRISLEMLRSRSEIDTEIKEQIRLNFVNHSTSLNTFFGFDLDAVRSSDAPGTSAPSPLGLRAGEFITLVKYAASLANTKIIEFSEVNPDYDQDDRTTKLVAIGMHRFCSGITS